MNISRGTLGFHKSATPMVSARCVACGDRFRALVTNTDEAARAHVDHVCGHGVVGPVWTLTIRPKTLTVRRAA